MHFSRSPFIAFAVTAMIGVSRHAGIWRISRIVSMPSISGIMISIRIASTFGCAVRVRHRGERTMHHEARLLEKPLRRANFPYAGALCERPPVIEFAHVLA